MMLIVEYIIRNKLTSIGNSSVYRKCVFFLVGPFQRMYDTSQTQIKL